MNNTIEKRIQFLGDQGKHGEGLAFVQFAGVLHGLATQRKPDGFDVGRFIALIDKLTEAQLIFQQCVGL